MVLPDGLFSLIAGTTLALYIAVLPCGVRDDAWLQPSHAVRCPALRKHGTWCVD